MREGMEDCPRSHNPPSWAVGERGHAAPQSRDRKGRCVPPTRRSCTWARTGGDGHEGPVQVRRSALTDEEFDACGRGWSRPFELLGGSLSRFEIRSLPTARYLSEDIHHIIMDGTSHGILAEDIARAYAGQELEPESCTG